MTRLARWEVAPIDMFFAVEQFHIGVGNRCRTVPFSGRLIRVLSAEDLAGFKALFDRGKDWVDIATMVESHAVDLEVAADRLGALVGDDSQLERLVPWRIRVDVLSGSRNA